MGARLGKHPKMPNALLVSWQDLVRFLSIFRAIFIVILVPGLSGYVQ